MVKENTNLRKWNKTTYPKNNIFRKKVLLYWIYSNNLSFRVSWYKLKTLC